MNESKLLARPRPGHAAAAWLPGLLACMLIVAGTCLPWAGGACRAAQVRESKDARSEVRELLAGYGIDQSCLDALIDRRPLDNDERETLYRILFRIPQIAPQLVHRWCQHEVSWSQVTEQPASHRVEFFHLTGTVTKVEADTLIPELAERFNFRRFYRVTMRLSDAANPVLVCARAIPEAWNPLLEHSATIDQPCSLCGMFLKVGRPTEPYPQWVFAANRIAWHPDSVDPRLGVTNDDVLLAGLGVDVGLLGQVRDRTRLVSQDRECFYQLLWAMDKPDWPATAPPVANIDIPGLLRDPKAQRGKRMMVRGGARRALRILVNDPDVRQRFGIDHYYEIDLFVPLDPPLELVDRDHRTRSVYGSYPVTVCVRHLPDGMPQGENIHEEIRVQAFFFKLWAYQKGGSDATGGRATEPGGNTPRLAGKGLQLSPLLVGRQVQWIRPPTSVSPCPGLVLGGLFAAAMVALCYRLWRSDRDHRQVERTFPAGGLAPNDDELSADADSGSHGNDGQPREE